MACVAFGCAVLVCCWLIRVCVFGCDSFCLVVRCVLFVVMRACLFVRVCVCGLNVCVCVRWIV